MQAGESTTSRPTAPKPCTCCAPRKGYVIVGQDTDGSVTVDDLGLGWAHFENQGRLHRQAFAVAARHGAQGSQATGRPDDRGSQTVIPGGRAAGRRSAGADAGTDGRPRQFELLQRLLRITRSRWRWSREAAIAWAKRFTHRSASGRVIKATITEPVFYDKEGAKPMSDLFQQQSPLVQIEARRSLSVMRRASRKSRSTAYLNLRGRPSTIPDSSPACLKVLGCRTADRGQHGDRRPAITASTGSAPMNG